jgi:hypothetical protein
VPSALRNVDLTLDDDEELVAVRALVAEVLPAGTSMSSVAFARASRSFFDSPWKSGALPSASALVSCEKSFTRGSVIGSCRLCPLAAGGSVTVT